MLAVSVQKDSKSLNLMRDQRLFAVNVLDATQRELAGQLGRSSAKQPNKMQGIGTTTGGSGTVVLRDALGYLECKVTGEVDAGDSVVFVAEIVDAGVLRNGSPLTMEATGFKHSG